MVTAHLLTILTVGLQSCPERTALNSIEYVERLLGAHSSSNLASVSGCNILVLQTEILKGASTAWEGI
jgi:hypothetical protein